MACLYIRFKDSAIRLVDGIGNKLTFEKHNFKPLWKASRKLNAISKIKHFIGK